MLRRVVCPASAATATQARTIYEYKFGQTPLTKPFKILVRSSMPKPAEDAIEAFKPSKVEVTKLHNGVRIISQDLGGPLVSVGAYILAGPAYDPEHCPGVGSMMHLALTTSNFNNSLFQLDRNIRSVGAAESHFEQYKHFIGLRIDSRADKWKSSPAAPARRNAVQKETEQHYEMNLVQDNIFTCLAAPRFHETDIERFRDTIDNQVKELRWQYPAQYAVQMLETVAFYREPLGNPSFVPEINNSHITSQVLLDQYSRYVVPSRIVVAGVNVEHAALVAEYENTPFPHSPSAPHHVRAAAESKAMRQVSVADEMKQYTGGEKQDHEDRAKEMGTKPDMDTESILAVGWLAFGRDRTTLKDYAASLVLKNLIDMQLNDGIRYQRDEMHVDSGIRTFYNPYNTAGLLGITITANPKDGVKMTTDAVKNIRSNKAPAQAEVEIAKKRAALQFRNKHSDNIRDYCDFLGTSLPIAGDSTSPVHMEEVINAINSVSAADVKKVTDCMFSHPTSFYGHGEMLAFPSARQMGL